MLKKLFPLTVVCLLLTGMSILMSSCAKEQEKVVNFSLYGTPLSVHFDASQCDSLKGVADEDVVAFVENLEGNAQSVVDECLQIKKELNLCDWAYFHMLDSLSAATWNNSNEVVAAVAVLMNQSGYDVRLLRTQENSLRLLYQTDAFVYGAASYIDGEKKYFLYGDSIQINDSCNVVTEATNGKAIDFHYQGEMKLAEKLSEPRTIHSVKDSTFTFTIQVNKNLIDFYADMPSFMYDNNFMTRWAVMAQYPLEQHLQQTLVREMKEKLAGKSKKEQVQQIHFWVQGNVDLKREKTNQDILLFAYDEDVWGADRAFYAEEALYYPYCDSEDRSILFAELVREVVGLDVALVYYPGHLSAAVCFDEPVEGDAYDLDGRKFVTCDPTYIGSKIGEIMPIVKHDDATLIVIK